MKDKDIVADILSRIEAAVCEYLSNHQGFEQSMADAIAHQIRAQENPIRKHWGGTEPYVAARSREREQAKQKALEEVRRSGNVAEASSRYGVSRATMYRLMRK